ncbi:NepR family anti-sigma factor [Microvirga pudoricolor]|uniref:NepR family anti-sigma factor n=1 Tax=Microvirga pudoricolor TaxID=2778729 RepID=UPI003898ED86
MSADQSRLQGPLRQPSVSPAAQARIGDQLRYMYEDLKIQPLPETILAVLRKLEQQGPASHED